MPYAKGEGVSLMVADFVSANYRWLRSLDGSQQARVLFKAGKAWQGYFTNEDILCQAMKAMDILQNNYQSEMHVFSFDNMTTERTMHCPLARCLRTCPGMARTEEWRSQCLMAMGSQSSTHVARSGAKKPAWGMPHLWMVGRSTFIFPKIIWTHLASSRGWL